MPRRSLTLRAAAVLAAATLGAGLTACADTTRIPPAPNDTGAAEPLFASDEEALAAAVEAYEEFLAVSAAILQDGGEDPERLRPVVSDEVYESELIGFRDISEQGLRAVGGTTLIGARLQQRIAEQDPLRELVVSYICVSREGSDVVDDEGQSIVNPDAPTELSFEVETEHSAERSIVTSKVYWGDVSVCE
jgi:hypothetical protein